jgi:FolB domain-containing protein
MISLSALQDMKMPSFSMSPTSHTDVVFINALQLTADVGPDCWNKQRAQPVNISVYVNLQKLQLSAARQSDDIQNSIHYGHLSKAITGLVEKKLGSSFDDIDGLISAVTRETFALAEKKATEVRVEIEFPKLILLAGSFSVEVATLLDVDVSLMPRKVTVADLVLPVIIGVNPPERNAKQRVVTSIVFFEHPPGAQNSLDYPGIVTRLSNVRFLSVSQCQSRYAYLISLELRISSLRPTSHWKSS